MSYRTLLIAAVAATGAPAALAQDYVAPHNAMGQPDLSGAWTNESLTRFERSPQYGERKVMTDEEVERLESGADQRWAAANAPTDPDEGAPEFNRVGGYNAYWVGNNNKVGRVGGEARTSHITYPANGRVPPRRADAPPKQTSNLQTIFFTPDVGNLESYETRSGAERCIFWPSHAGAVMRAAAYNANYQITQGADAVVILIETINDARIIPLRDKHDPSSAVTRKWMGDSIGRYEGDTLVVETINFHPDQYFYYASEQLKVTERFTRVGEGRLLYQFHVEDPLVWDEAWGGEYEFTTSDGVHEYACHEGNYAMYNALRIGRMQDAGVISADNSQAPR